MSDPNNDNSTSAVNAAHDDDPAHLKKNNRQGRIRRAKKSAIFRFKNLKIHLHRKKRRLNFGFLCKKSEASCFSFNFRKKPLNLNLDSSPGDSQTSDPNDPDFTLDMLKGLIEKNDFYSVECNTHFDVNSD